MRANRLPLAPLALIAASLACPLATAQHAAGGTQPNPQVIRPGDRQPTDRAAAPVLSVEFAGGTLGQFVDAVKGATTETINVVVPAEAMALSVPRLSLKNVTPYMALQSLEYINQRTAPVSTFQQPSGMMYPGEIKIQDLNQTERSPHESARTFAIVYTKRDKASQMGIDIPGVTQTTQVFTVRDLLKTEGANGMPGLTLDEVVSPLEKTLSVEAGNDGADSDGPPAKLMVHKESNLIIVKGTSRQNALVKQVLDRLKEDVDRTRASVMPQRDRALFVEDMRKQNQIRQQTLREHLKESHARAQALRDTIDKSSADKNDRTAASARSDLTQVEANIASLSTQLNQAALQSAEVEFEASRQWRGMSGNTASVEVKALREQVEQLRKQIEEMKGSARSGSSK